MDRTAAPKTLTVTEHGTASGALRYWRSRPAAERVAAVEFLRRQWSGTGARLQRVLRTVERPAR